MKTKFSSNSNVCHEFTKQDQSYGEANNVFFEHDEIYSFGHHFCMAKIIDNDKRIALFTTRSYSTYTGRHLNLLSGAMSHYTLVYVAYPERDYRENFLYVQQEIEEYLRKIKTARSAKSYYIQEARKQFEYFMEYIRVTKIRLTLELKKETRKIEKILYSNEMDKELGISLVKNEERRVKAEEKKVAEEKENIIKFREGEARFGYISGATLLRSTNGDIETSKNMKVSKPESKSLYKLWKKGKALGQKLQGYSVILSNEKEIKIGCHHIMRSEIDYIANQLNWNE